MQINSYDLDCLLALFEKCFIIHPQMGNIKFFNHFINTLNNRGIDIQLTHGDKNDKYTYCITNKIFTKEYKILCIELKNALLGRQHTKELVNLLNYEKQIKKLSFGHRKIKLCYDLHLNNNNISIVYWSNSPVFSLILERDLLTTQSKFKITTH